MKQIMLKLVAGQSEDLIQKNKDLNSLDLN